MFIALHPKWHHCGNYFYDSHLIKKTIKRQQKRKHTSIRNGAHSRRGSLFICDPTRKFPHKTGEQQNARMLRTPRLLRTPTPPDMGPRKKLHYAKHQLMHSSTAHAALPKLTPTPNPVTIFREFPEFSRRFSGLGWGPWVELDSRDR